MAAYALSRVKRITVELVGTSLEAGAVQSVNVIFSDTQPSTVITSYALARAAQISYLHTPVRKIGVNVGNSTFKIIPITTTPAKIIGDKMPNTDRDFVTQINPSHSAPVQEVWTAVVLTSANSSTNITNGLDITFTITAQVEAFSRLVGA